MAEIGTGRGWTKISVQMRMVGRGGGRKCNRSGAEIQPMDKIAQMKREHWEKRQKTRDSKKKRRAKR